jgi:hypothetical protein
MIGDGGEGPDVAEATTKHAAGVEEVFEQRLWGRREWRRWLR